MSGAPIHRCATAYCPAYSQATDRSCKCHQTSEQILLAQRDELLTWARRLANALALHGSSIELQLALRGVQETIAAVEAA